MSLILKAFQSSRLIMTRTTKYCLIPKIIQGGGLTLDLTLTMTMTMTMTVTLTMTMTTTSKYCKNLRKFQGVRMTVPQTTKYCLIPKDFHVGVLTVPPLLDSQGPKLNVGSGL